METHSIPFEQGDAHAMAADANDNLYIANSEGSVNIYNSEKESLKSFVILSFAPSGVAVDSVRGRVYFSNTGGTRSGSTAPPGTFLHTIQ